MNILKLKLKTSSINICLVFLISIFFLLNISNIKAQEIKRPSVGLVLSGGAAHGIAHLGVIKVMEESGLKPDYISGVSMGSIIGGLYSIGYSTDSIFKILKNVNWDLLLSNNVPENKVIFLEKMHFNNSILSLSLSSKKMTLPSGLINGQQFENMLSYYTWPAADINDFSKLPIPFMCLGTDIKNYKSVKLKSGYLSDAIRASSSVPSVFSPIKIDTTLLIDGGLTRNFAASEAKDMGADITIGSYVGYTPITDKGLESVSGILLQIAMYRSAEDFADQKKYVDILIKPETARFPIMGFENVDSLYKKGYDAALPFKEQFKKIADSLNKIGPRKPVANILDKKYYTFDKIEITGNKIYSDHQILGVLDIEPNEKVDKDLLFDRLDLLYGKAWFDKVKYRFEPRNDSLILVIDCDEKPNSVFYSSAHYDNSLQTGLLLGFSFKDLISTRSVINFNSFISQYYRLELNATQFIDMNQKFGLSANFYLDNTLIPMLELRNFRSDIVGRNFLSGLSLSKRIGLNNMMSLSVNYENLNLIIQRNAYTSYRNFSYNYLSTEYDYKRNSLDNKHFPDKGSIMNFSVSLSKLISGGIKSDTSKKVYREYGNNEFSFNRFLTIYYNINKYFSPSRKATFSLGGNVLFITDSDSTSSQDNFFLLGGYSSVNRRSIPMIGFHPNEIPVKRMAGIRSSFDLEFYNKIHLEMMADFSAIQEENRNSGFSFISGYGIGLGYMSIIGPLRLGLMYGNYSKEEYFRAIKGYISFGYNF
jgi:NTE family protein